jgi:phosphoribosylanthranilate isomerase
VQESDLTGIQLHVSHDPELPGRLRERMASVGGSRLRVLSVLPFSEDMEGAIRAVERDAAVDALLIDSRTAAAHGGTGQTFDWQAAQALLRAVSSRLRLVVAGGLGPENVAEAIHRLRPWGVDVASGVEAAPGRKDPARVAGFLRVARQAFGEIERGGASQG